MEANIQSVINELLLIEHEHMAKRFEFINYQPKKISQELLYKAIGVLDELSINRETVEKEKRENIIIILCAILWTYKEKEWGGLKDFLILVLSRIGYAPSSRMFDENYDFDNNKYSEINSIFAKIAITTYQNRDTVKVGDRQITLTDFQRNIWEKVNNYKIVGISAPTSAGKSYIILLKSVQLLLEKQGSIVYIVPTLSLVNQVSIDYRKTFKDYGIKDYEILNS